MEKDSYLMEARAAERQTAVSNTVIERPELHRFELAVEGGLAYASYRIEDGRLVLIHTEVPQELSGRGIGSQLAKGVFDIVRESKRKVVLRCPLYGGVVRSPPGV